MTVTLKQIADKAQVSHGAVSAVLNRHTGNIRVATATRERILRIADELGYRPNSLARGLRGSKTKTVGMIWPMVDEWSGDSGVGPRILRRLQAEGYATYHADCENKRDQLINAIDELRHRCVDALIVRATPSFLRDAAVYDRLNAMPAVLAVTQEPIDELTCDQLHHDRFASIEQVAIYLAQSGKLRPTMVVAMGDPDNHIKYRTFWNRLKGLGIAEHSSALIDLGKPRLPRWDMVRDAMDKAYAEGIEVDAIFCLNDMVAMCVATYLRERGVAIPGDVALVGMNDAEPSALWSPPLASIRRKRDEVTDAAVDMVLKRLADPKQSPSLCTISMEFVWRESAGPAPHQEK